MDPQLHDAGSVDNERPSGQNQAKELGRFRVLDTLGVGGFGVVYLAFDTTLKRKVAIKLPKQAAFIDQNAKERFMREAEIAANLHHPNIVPVFEAGEAKGLCYLASAYCSGPSLAKWHHENEKRVDSRVAACIVGKRLATHRSGHFFASTRQVRAPCCSCRRRLANRSQPANRSRGS